MPEYLSPGVYVEEIDAGPKPIEGVSTSTAGAVGVTRLGPSTGKPELVTSFTEFQRKFGGFLDHPEPKLVNDWALRKEEGARWWLFPLSVKGFFDNGGQRLYVKRVFARNGAKASSTDLGQGVIAELTHDAAATADTIRVRQHLGVQNNDQVHLFAGGVALTGNPFTVTGYDASARLTLNKPVGAELKAGTSYVQIVARNATGTLKVTAKSVGEWGDDVRVRVRPMVGGGLSILANPLLPANAGGPTAKVVTNPDLKNVTVDNEAGFSVHDGILIGATEHVITAIDVPTKKFTFVPDLPAAVAANTPVVRIRGTQTTLAAAANAGDPDITVNLGPGFIAGDRVRIDGKDYTISAPTAPAGAPPTRKFTITPAVPAGGWPLNLTVARVPAANTPGPGAKTLNVQNASQLYVDALVELDNGTQKERFTVTEVIGQTVTFSADLANNYFPGHLVRLIEAVVEVEYRPGDVVEATEIFSNLRLVDDSSLSYIVRHVNAQSKYVNLEAIGLSNDLKKFPSVPPPLAGPQQHWAKLEKGEDAYDKLTVDDFVGVDEGSGKRTGITALEDIDEISICMVPDVWAKTVRDALITHCETLKDRFAILDPKDGLSIEEIREVRETMDSKYAALYYPWLQVRDPSVGRNVHVAPSAHMAGVYARVDVERGVHKAPANEVIRNITDIEQHVTRREQDLLNPKGINALRFFPGRGNRVWGARTISSDSSWKYINVRRLFLFVEESIDEGTQWVVFEPNDEPLWARVRQTITNFLTSVWRTGALQGATADEAFFVRCDRTTMTQDDIDNGRLICLIGIAPVKPAEFVIFRIQQKTLETPAT
jgi:uncharacterized protein